MPEFEPKIVAFCCRYCAYTAADLAGSMRLQYSPNIRVVEMPCSGTIEHGLILSTFEKGVDGVYIAGCNLGDCHFLKGNVRAIKRVAAVKKILDEIGLGGERLEFFHVPASEGTKFAQVANEMTERIRQLGPSPLNKNAAGNAQKEGGQTA
ncbi:Methyl-viologen-reducing hydrogenase, delta subunit [Sporotomaculum syntrophicum]|uniref:Methyl-viologen-reducing hydrogenase, delta subunit n=1 Tax=Sporotomaculum syntrophicum TaxID=182264 RepID=A0A9D2WQE3_9FIRM|nr:hydrogenase iron-sulfur subunit [Sporotomaculum syntrophicum]KAF1084697.1 Methyl-viologen-reducing hydrogenase, delta subunit [Sporotomaculum syntrophicum]